MNAQSSELKIKILGDSGPFSSTGRSISYLIQKDDFKFLIDAGAPVFQLLNFPDICSIDAVAITHPHDDHKRWLSDLLLFRKYVTPQKPKVKLFASEDIHSELKESMRHALEKTLSPDSQKVVRTPYDEFVDCVVLGPTAKYSLKRLSLTGSIENQWAVIDENNNILSAEQAKVIIHPKTGDPDILFYDSEDKCWVNPEIYYDFSDTRFYKTNTSFEHEKSGVKIRLVNAPVWHGITAVGIVVETADTKIFFSGDTVHNITLWKNFAAEPLIEAIENNKKISANKALIDDINKYIERTWSFKRYKDALAVYIESDFIIHDSASVSSIVHTDFEDVNSFNKEKTLLTHSPDNYVSNIPLTCKDKNYVVKNKQLFEFISGNYYKINADVYIKHQARYFVGYKNRRGNFAIIENEKGILELKFRADIKAADSIEYYELFEDIGGGYYPADMKLAQTYINLKETVYKQEIKEDGRILLIPQQNQRGQ